jgi:hypothetical protein
MFFSSAMIYLGLERNATGELRRAVTFDSRLDFDDDNPCLGDFLGTDDDLGLTRFSDSTGIGAWTTSGVVGLDALSEGFGPAQANLMVHLRGWGDPTGFCSTACTGSETAIAAGFGFAMSFFPSHMKVMQRFLTTVSAAGFVFGETLTTGTSTRIGSTESTLVIKGIGGWIVFEVKEYGVKLV